ncbi:MAG: GFA family protein [Pseudomonadota bacterium]
MLSDSSRASGEKTAAGFRGGCLCGTVRYEVTSEPVNMWNCHCADCRKVTGARYATNVFVKVDDLKVTAGKTATFRHLADSGNTMTKEYCPECGSQLFNSSSGRAALKVVRAGSIDDPSFVKPRANIFAANALPGAAGGDGIPTFDRMPPDPSVFFKT